MLTVQEILKATKGKLLAGLRNSRFLNVSTDSRKSPEKSLFIPLIGERFDGHRFIGEALRKGASGALTSKPLIALPSHKTIIKVKDTLKTLQNIAAYHRSKFKLPVIGVTGSTGKTTVKDMIASILSGVGVTLKTNENYNNEIGVPLTLLKLNKKHKAAVIEMAMTGLGEIRELAKIAQPRIAVITNIGLTHVGRLKSVRKIAQAKSEILDFLKKGDFAVLPADDKYFSYLKNKAKNKGARIIPFGFSKDADINEKDLTIKLPLPGRHMVLDALAAVAVAKILKVNRKSIEKGLKQVKTSAHRMQIFVNRNRVRVIDDTYNANPHSMQAALEVLRDQKGRRIAVLGNMLELGQRSAALHKKIGKLAAKYNIDSLITVGKLGALIAQAAQDAGSKEVFAFGTKNEAVRKIKSLIKPKDVVLVKASRGMKLEEIVGALRP